VGAAAKRSEDRLPPLVENCVPFLDLVGDYFVEDHHNHSTRLTRNTGYGLDNLIFKQPNHHQTFKF
jgi:hypothetical protein